jgi:hypothetical protein
VEILDFDNFDASPERELSLWSQELREYWAKKQAQWDRCQNDCRCWVRYGFHNSVPSAGCPSQV